MKFVTIRHASPGQVPTAGDPLMCVQRQALRVRWHLSRGLWRLSVGFAILTFLNAGSAANFSVSMTSNNKFAPPDLTISVGDTVTWTVMQGNHDTVSGSSGVPSGVWNSNDQYHRLMRIGETFSFTFNVAGTFPYYCTPHWQFFGMVGTIRVMAADAPTITSRPQPQTVNASNDVVFTVQATGTPPLNYQWFFEQNIIVGATGVTLLLTNVSSADSGTYTVRVTNAFGSDSASATLTVTNTPMGTPPSITTQPQSQTVEPGTNVTFTADAIGSAPLNWQWFFNGSAIAFGTNSSLELTNVTSANVGDYFAVVANAFGAATSSVVTLALFPANNDFDHDGNSDFLWQNVDGRVRLWLMEGVTRIGALLLRNGRPAAPGWRIVGTHDFNQDRNTDILWQHSNGQLAIWFMNGTNYLRSEFVSGAPALGRPWRVVGLGDFNRDGHKDILFRHTDGYLLVWLMKGPKFSRQFLLYNGEPIPSRWRVVGVADVNHDEQPDILWQSPESSIVIWFMNGLAPTTGPLLSHLPRLNAKIVGLNDLNRDGNLDFIWRHTDNHLSVWWMNGTNLLGAAEINGGEVVSSASMFVAPKD
jgi:plastocyanin